MKRYLVFISMLISLLTSFASRSAEIKVSLSGKGNKSGSLLSRERPEIHVVAGDWDGATPEEIEAVLNVVADELLAHFPETIISPIIVSPTQRNPVVLFQKSADDKYQVHLAAKGTKWAEYIYEFSHELFHILANYQKHAPPKSSTHLWLEESLCESASVYTLKKLSLVWAESPARAEWASYAPTLKQFTQRVVGEQRHYLPAKVSLAKWIRENEVSLINDPYLRDKNALVANLFLPLLEQNQDWEAVAFLNTVGRIDQVPLRDYLAGWHQRTPSEHQELTRQVMHIFESQPLALSAKPIEKRIEESSYVEPPISTGLETPTKKPS